MKAQEIIEAESLKDILANLSPVVFRVYWHDTWGSWHRTTPFKSIDKALRFAYTSSLFNKAEQVFIEEYPRTEPDDLIARHHLNRNYEIDRVEKPEQ